MKNQQFPLKIKDWLAADCHSLFLAGTADEKSNLQLEEKYCYLI